MKCLVTGGAGFIGSNLVDLLIQEGHEVSVLDNLLTGHLENLNPSAEFIKGSIEDVVLLDSILEGKEAVFHLAASVGNKKSIEDPYIDQQLNYIGTLNILESMRKHKVSKIVFSSSAGIFGEPQYEPVDEKHPCEPDSPYGVSKLAGEKLILSYAKLYGIQAVCLRYFNVFGPRQFFDAYGNVIPIFAKRALANEPICIYGDGEQTRDFIYVKDIAKINYLSAKSDYTGVLNLGTGQRMKIKDLAEKVVELAQSSSSIEYMAKRPGDVLHCTANTKQLQETLNYTPSQDFEKLLAEYMDWAKTSL